MMNLSHQNENDICTINIDGAVVLDYSSTVRNYVNELLNAQIPRALILNFNKTTNIDSVGIGMVISLLKTLKRQNCTLIICQMNPKVDKIIKMLGLHKVIDVFETEAAAIAAVDETY
ncbi:MAG: STAS domain-containing protein [SAR324 cluster bacterium]|nr:STAS domain-containing protein [SAR324 cluster bacterium]